MNNLFAGGRKKVCCGFESGSYNAVSEKGIDIWDGLDIGGVEEFVGLRKGFQSVSQISMQWI